MKKPVIVEKFADNGEHSHWSLVDCETGELLWSQAPEEEMQQVKLCNKPAVIKSVCTHERTKYSEFCNGDFCQDCGKPL